jgi:hypothetical protein
MFIIFRFLYENFPFNAFTGLHNYYSFLDGQTVPVENRLQTPASLACGTLFPVVIHFLIT